MSSDLNYLSKLINMVEIENSDHNKKKLWSLISMLARKEIGATDQKDSANFISDVHELNLEQIIKIQAIGFYGNFQFPQKNIDILIEDFISMEHNKRRNDFEGFALSVYQQIENVVNYIYLRYNLTEKLVRDKYNPSLTVREGRTNSSGPLYETIFKSPYIKHDTQKPYTEEEKKQYSASKLKSYMANGKIDFVDKSRVVMFYYYFDAKLSSYLKWNDMSNKLTSIHLARNTVHRNIKPVNPATKYNSQNYYSLKYLEFQGFLADLMDNFATIILRNP